jgi:hypothetical protein
MRDSADNPTQDRLRTLRRRVAAAVLATFVAAWLAVAALGKGAAGTAAATSAAPSTGTSGQDDGSADPAITGDGSSSDDFGPSQGDDESGQSQSAQGGPVTTSQS